MFSKLCRSNNSKFLFLAIMCVFLLSHFMIAFNNVTCGQKSKWTLGSDVTTHLRSKGHVSFVRNEMSIHGYKDIIDDKYTEYLGNQLKNILEINAPQDSFDITSRSCMQKEVLDRSCGKEGCLRTQLPRDLFSRVEQLVKPAHLRLDAKYKKVLEDMRDSVTGYYDVIFATAASANHYLESKALIANLRKNVFPILKNFTFIYYDLGLKDDQRADISRICQCQVRTFPFPRLPAFFETLKCYSWKPSIVYAHAPQSRLLFWVDSSIRFSNDSRELGTLFRLTTERGLQTGHTFKFIPWVTLNPMFHFYGDEPCMYHPYFQCSAASILFHNEPLILDAVITPWAACAFTESCMCPNRVDTGFQSCPPGSFEPNISEYTYGRCHRFDQSALAIIIRKLFQEKSHHLLRSSIFQHLQIKRGNVRIYNTIDFK